MGYLARFSLRIAQTFDISFAFSFKLPVILADVLTAALLWKIWKEWRGPVVASVVVAAFGWSLVSILVSGFHGNTDSLCVFFILLSAYFTEKKRPLAGGLALAAALNVKLLPIVLIPAFVLRYRSWQEFMKFSAGLAVGVLPFLPFWICCGKSFYQNAIAYNSNANYWGVRLFLLHSAEQAALRQLARQVSDFYVPNGRFLIMGLIFFLSGWAHLRDRWNRYELGALCFSIFLILTPGFGVQYAVYAVPLLFAVSIGWGILYSVAAGTFIGLVYYSLWTGTRPFFSQFAGTEYPMPAALVGLVAWGFLIQFTVWCFYRPTAIPEPRVDCPRVQAG